MTLAGVGSYRSSIYLSRIRYFSCSDNCGVFVAASKLSPGRFYQKNLPRAPSVSSSKSGRTSFSGRITPSLASRMPSFPLSGGRVTPLNGYITPSKMKGRTTPGVTPVKSINTSNFASGQMDDAKNLPDKITPGSRAAKYANMTAAQLSSRKEKTSRLVSQPNSSFSPSSSISRTVSSPSRPSSSPFSTPKPGLNGRIPNKGPPIYSIQSRSTHNTPRGRIPSSVVMPPPASPACSVSRSTSLNQLGLDGPTLSSLEFQGKALQDRVSLLLGDEGKDDASDRSDSANLSQQTNNSEGHILELHARLDVLQVENARLISDKESVIAQNQVNLDQQLEEGRRKAAEERDALMKEKEGLSKALELSLIDLADLRDSCEVGSRRIEDLENHLVQQSIESQGTSEALKCELANVNSMRQKLEQENRELQVAKADLKIQIDELGFQIDELRLAGQVRLSCQFECSKQFSSCIGNHSSL